jgi:hypothetical protein
MNEYCSGCVERLFGCTQCDPNKWRHKPTIKKSLTVEKVYRPIIKYKQYGKKKEKFIKREPIKTGSFLED